MRASNFRENIWRTLLTFNVTRVVIAVLLLGYVVFNIKKEVSAEEQFAYWQTCIVYLVLAVFFAVFAAYYRGRFVLQTLSQITVDITVISFLYIAAGGVRSGLSILYLFPLLGGAVLLPLVWALFFASIVTLFLLTESGYQIVMSTTDASFSQPGLYGTAFLASVYSFNWLAGKLINEENLARRHGQALQVQEAINRLVIADMGDGILVVGHDSAVQISNPAAERMLGMPAVLDEQKFLLADIAALAPIAEAFFAWVEKSAERKITDASTYVVIKRGDEAGSQAGTAWAWRRDLTVRLKLRFGTVKTIGEEGDRTVIFLQDVTEIENQAQQLKLASMGRLTASIAHEVRNPLSAISYAASLLSEDLSDSGSRRLLNIVADNVARLNRMIEDILKLSRKAQSQNAAIELLPFFSEIVTELQQTHMLDENAMLLLGLDQQRVRFDPLHLREVATNLLSNALRYASGRAGSIRVQLVSDSAGRLELHVQDDGTAIAPEVRAHLFEPFYTTSSKGTGLGLYVARELCLNNGAVLDYEYRMERSDEGHEEAQGRFVVTFAAMNDT